MTRLPAASAGTSSFSVGTRSTPTAIANRVWGSAVWGGDHPYGRISTAKSIDAIKLDGSLTREVMHNTSCQEIIASVGQLCRNQDVRMVAEYVEALPQRDLLASLGCDGFQGWLYSPAVGPEACRAYIEARRAAP